VKPADDPTRDYRILVRVGYDACAPAFNAERREASADALMPLLARLPAGARVLDLGCGAGMPVASTLATRYRVVGVDLSSGQLALARQQVPSADFVLGDIGSCAFAPASFDAIVSFYAIFHLPRSEHQPLFARVYEWLKPGGYLLASLAMTDEGNYTEEDFFGVEMYWSNFDMPRYRTMLADASFDLLAEATLTHGYADSGAPAETHPVVFAQRRL
jgi:cyclopropane fatty-acyl-phospholipid synthase-like methyltransferase